MFNASFALKCVNKVGSEKDEQAKQPIKNSQLRAICR